MQKLIRTIAECLRNGKPIGCVRVELRNLLLDTSPAAATMRQHPLGFLRLELGRGEDGSQLLMHCWHERLRAPQDISLLRHAHMFDVYSEVLVGRLTDRLYRWHEEQDGPFALYRTQVSIERSSLVATNETGRLGLEASRPVSRGERYVVPVGIFHETDVPTDERTITLALLDRPVRESSLVAVPTQSTGNLQYERRAVSPAIVADIIAEAIAALS